MELKEKLVALRKEKGLTQSAVAEKLDVSRQAISRWESGVALPSTDNLKSLSALYGVPVDYLLNSDTEEQRVTKGLEAENCMPMQSNLRKRSMRGKNTIRIGKTVRRRREDSILILFLKQLQAMQKRILLIWNIAII